MTQSVGLKDITKQLQLTPRRVQQLANEGVIVKTGRGTYDMCRSAIQYSLYLRRQRGSEASLPCSLDEIVSALGVSKNVARYLDRQNVFCKTDRGNYDLICSIRGYMEFLRKMYERWGITPSLFDEKLEVEKKIDSGL